MSQIDRALHLIDSHRPDQASELLEEYLVQEPDDAEAHVLLGLALCMQMQIKKGLECIDHGIALNPEESRGHVAKGIVLGLGHKFGPALKSFEQALRLEPDDAEIFGHRSEVYLAKEDWEKALEDAERGIELDPEEKRSWVSKSMALIRLGKLEEAEQALQSAARLRPAHVEVITCRGHLALEQGDVHQARLHFLDALRIDSEDFEARSGYLDSLRADHKLFYWPMVIGRQLGQKQMNPAKWTLRILLRGSIVVAILAGADVFKAVLVLPGFIIGCAILAPVYFLFRNWFDLALLVTPEGRAVLEPGEQKRLRWFLSGIGGALVCLVLAATLKWQFVIGALALLLGQMPVAIAYFSQLPSMAKRIGIIAVLCNLVVIAGVILECILPSEGIGLGLQITMVGGGLSILGGWAGALMAQKVN